MYLFFILLSTFLCNALHGSMDPDPNPNKKSRSNSHPNSRSSSSSSDTNPLRKSQELQKKSRGSRSPSPSPRAKNQIIKLPEVPEQTTVSDYFPEQKTMPARDHKTNSEYPSSQLIRKKSTSPAPEFPLNTSRNALRKSQGTCSETAHGFLVAIASNDVKKINLYLSNDFFNPNNIVDLQGKTCLHIAAQYNNFEVLPWLLEDPRPNARLLDNDGKRADQLLQKPELSFEYPRNEDGYIVWLPDYSPDQSTELKAFNNYLFYSRMLFARFVLNNMVTKYTPQILSAYSTGYFDEPVINGTVDKIESDIRNDTENQATPLPKDSQLSAYAIKPFIRKMLDFELATLTNAQYSVTK